MSSWTELLRSMKLPERQTQPPRIKDVWLSSQDHEKRITDLEYEVKNLKAVLVAVLAKLHETE